MDAYDSAAFTISTNNSVLQWRDKSLCNFHFSNTVADGTSLLLPTYTINPNNSLPGLLFSSDGNTLRTTLYNNTNFNFNTLYDATAFIVFQQRNQVSADGYVFTGLSNGENEFNNGNGFVVKQGSTYVSLTRSSIGVTISGINTTNTTLVTSVFNSSFSTTLITDIPQNNFAIGRNGNIGRTNISSFISSLSINFSTIRFNMRQGIIGSRTSDGTDKTTYFDGYFHEVLLYNRTLSFVERQQVESYLMCKWNI